VVLVSPTTHHQCPPQSPAFLTAGFFRKFIIGSLKRVLERGEEKTKKERKGCRGDVDIDILVQLQK
jgi:hypothetical protein